jgi:hypothetical protein
MGRSRNTALILVSQNAGDLLNEQVTNCLSGVFAFRSSERVEVSNVMALLGAEPTPEHLAVLRGLGNGECIFRDLEGRIGRIGIDLISDEMRRWLDTNPTRGRPTDDPPVRDAVPEPDPALAPAVAPGQDRGRHAAGRSDRAEQKDGEDRAAGAASTAGPGSPAESRGTPPAGGEAPGA